MNLPPLMHGNDWHGQDVSGWWCSEKYTGWRTYWDGKRLLSRYGKAYAAPACFTALLPGFALDCELWLGRGYADNDVHRAIAAGHWSRLQLVVFDVPGMAAESAIATLALLRPSPHIEVAKFWRVQSTAAARAAMAMVVASGGEGVMLRKPGSFYRNTRTDDLLKLKP